MKNDTLSIKNKKPHEETMDIVENILQSNHEIKEDFSCDLTQKSINCESYGNTASNEIHGGIKNHPCKFCDKKFRLKHNLKGHVRTVHEGVTNNECDICGKEFGHLGTLKRHIKVVHEKRRNFKCDTCDKSFTLLHHLKRHKIMVHESITMN